MIALSAGAAWAKIAADVFTHILHKTTVDTRIASGQNPAVGRLRHHQPATDVAQRVAKKRRRDVGRESSGGNQHIAGRHHAPISELGMRGQRRAGNRQQ